MFLMKIRYKTIYLCIHSPDGCYGFKTEMHGIMLIEPNNNIFYLYTFK
jgi:hypothetical protein